MLTWTKELSLCRTREESAVRTLEGRGERRIFSNLGRPLFILVVRWIIGKHPRALQYSRSMISTINSYSVTNERINILQQSVLEEHGTLTAVYPVGGAALRMVRAGGDRNPLRCLEM